MNYLRAYRDLTTDELTFVASTPGMKSDGLEIDQDRWDLSRYEPNPVFLWAHDYGSLPLGRAEAWVEGGKLRARVTKWAQTPMAQDVEQAYRDGILNAVSVGWEDVDDSGRPIKRGQAAARHVLLDISAVPVPGDPAALVERQRAAWTDLGRELLRLSQTDSADGLELEVTREPGTADDTEAGMADDEQVDGVSADEPGDGTSDVRGEDAWATVAAAMVAIFDPESDDPDDTREKAYRALLPKYRRHGVEPPEYLTADEVKALGERELAGLFLSGELDAAAWVGSRVAKVLAARNWKRIEQAHGLLGEVLSDAGAKDNKPDEPDDKTERTVEDVTPEPESPDPLAELRAMRLIITGD